MQGNYQQRSGPRLRLRQMRATQARCVARERRDAHAGRGGAGERAPCPPTPLSVPDKEKQSTGPCDSAEVTDQLQGPVRDSHSCTGQLGADLHGEAATLRPADGTLSRSLHADSKRRGSCWHRNRPRPPWRGRALSRVERATEPLPAGDRSKPWQEGGSVSPQLLCCVRLHSFPGTPVPRQPPKWAAGHLRARRPALPRAPVTRQLPGQNERPSRPVFRGHQLAAVIRPSAGKRGRGRGPGSLPTSEGLLAACCSARCPHGHRPTGEGPSSR